MGDLMKGGGGEDVPLEAEDARGGEGGRRKGIDREEDEREGDEEACL